MTVGIRLHSTIIYLGGILVGVWLSFFPGGGSCMAAENMVFQEYEFNVPTMRYVVLGADFQNSEFLVVERGDLGLPSRYQIKVVLEGKEYSGFRYPGEHGDLYDMYYLVATGDRKYKTVICDKQTKKIVRVLDELVDGGMVGDNLYYVDGLVLKKRNVRDDSVSVLRSNVSAIAVLPRRIILFCADGVISDIEGRQLGKFSGVITDAGSIDDEWIWFYVRKNEKTTGELAFLNAVSLKRISANLKLPQIKLLGLIQTH